MLCFFVTAVVFDSTVNQHSKSNRETNHKMENNNNTGENTKSKNKTKHDIKRNFEVIGIFFLVFLFITFTSGYTRRRFYP